MIVSVVNHSRGRVADEELHRVVRAVNRQVREDLAPLHGYDAELRVAGRSERAPSVEAMRDLRGDAVLYVVAGDDEDDAVGWHERNGRGVPYGFVSLALAEALGEPWSVTLSHEAIEMVADPEVNLLVLGPHPDPRADRRVLHWYELCDAVQDDRYEIDGVEVSDFLLPLWFTDPDERGGRNDFLGRLRDGAPLASFRPAAGGYLGFWDPETSTHETWTAPGDARARARLETRASLGFGRRARRRAHGGGAPASRSREGGGGSRA
jgi:hypothetical protein